MRTIKFSSRKFWRTKQISSHIPESMGELTQKQYLAVMRVANDIANANDDKFLNVLTGIPVKTIKKATEFEKYKLNDMFGFLSDDKPFHQLIIKNFIHNEIQYDGPTDFLANLSFIEFVFVDSYFMRHMSGDEDIRFKLIACLYRKHVISKDSELFEGDTREKFSEHRIEQRANEFKTLDPAIISGIVYNYRAIRQLIELKYSYLFPKADNDVEADENEKPEPKPQKQNFNGWAVTFKKFVDEDLVNEDKYAEMGMHRVLEVINNRILENIKNG